MKYCFNCGKEVYENAEYCMNCGVALVPAKKEDKGGFIWGLIGFFSPLIGLIVYFLLKEDKPKSAKSAGKGALISVITPIALMLLLFSTSFLLSIIGSIG